MKNKLFTLLMLMMLAGCATGNEKIETLFYPSLPQQPKLQFLMSISNELDIGKKAEAFKEFLIGKTAAQKSIARPYSIASVPGKIYVCDRTIKKILIIDLEKKEFDYIRDEKAGSLDQPAGLWITSEGKKYIADFGRNQVLVFDAEDDFIKMYGTEGQFGRPLDVAVYENRMYVADFDKHHIAVVDLESGDTVGVIGGEGSEDGKMFRPTHLTIDKDGNIFVTDSFNFRIQKFTSDGKFTKKFGYQGDTLGGFARPKGVDVDRDGFLYAVDTAFENVQIFNDESALLALYFGGFGGMPGNMYLPNAVHIDYDNTKYFQKYVDKDFSVKYLVFVGNTLGEYKINVYGFGEWTGDPLPEVPRKKIKLD